MVNWNSDGGSMFQIMFKSGQALLLSKLRFSCPRIGRGGGAERLRNMDCSSPQTRPSHDHDPVQCRTQTQIVRVRDQSASAPQPRQQSRSQIVHVHGLATNSIVHERATARVADCPQPGQVHEPSMLANCPRTRFVRSRRPAMNYARHDIAVSAWASENFPVQIQTIPTYDHV